MHNYYNRIDAHQSMYNVTRYTSIVNTPNRPKVSHRLVSSMQLSLSSYANSDDQNNYLPMIPLLPKNVKRQIFSKDTLTGANNQLPFSLLPILRCRSQFNDKQILLFLHVKGMETYITWEKLYLRAEKMTHELKKAKLYKMDNLLLWYNKEEVIEFTIALLGCFIAEMITVPISFEIYSLEEIGEIIKQTNLKRILISNANN